MSVNSKISGDGNDSLAPFVVGVLGVLVLGLLLRKRDYSTAKNGPMEDRDALRGDFARVGDDMNVAIKKSGYVAR